MGVRALALRLAAGRLDLDGDRTGQDRPTGSISIRRSIPVGCPAAVAISARDWADPVLGLRGRYAFNKWFATALVDAGGFGGGSDQSWQGFASVGYQFDPRWSVQGGWRCLAVEKDVQGQDVEVDLSGPIFGFTVRF